MTLKICEPAVWEIINALAGGRIYFLEAPQNAEAPFIVMQRTDSSRWRSINGPSGFAQAYIQVDVYAGEFYAAKALGAEVESLLDGYKGKVYYGSNSPQDYVLISGISLQNELDTLDQTDAPKLYRNLSTFLVTYNQKD